MAWAVGITTHRYWPYDEDDLTPGGYEWPSGIERAETLEAWEAFLLLHRFERCADGRLERGWERVALYAQADMRTVPSHAAWQLDDGRWTSKLGNRADVIHHTPEVMNSRDIGVVVRYYRRRRQRYGLPEDPYGHLR